MVGIIAHSVKEGVYMNHFKFSDTLGGFALNATILY